MSGCGQSSSLVEVVSSDLGLLWGEYLDIEGSDLRVLGPGVHAVPKRE